MQISENKQPEGTSRWYRNTQNTNYTSNTFNSLARKQADDHSIIFEEDLDSEGELAVNNAMKY